VPSSRGNNTRGRFALHRGYAIALVGSVSRLRARARARTHARVINNVAETFAARVDSAKNRPLTWSPILFPSRCLSHWRPDRDVGRRDVEVGHPAEDRPRRKRESRNARETRPVAVAGRSLRLRSSLRSFALRK